MVLALELEEVDQGSEEEKLDLERVEEEEERSMRGQDVEKRAPSRPLLGLRSTEALPRPALFIMTSHRWTEVKVFRKESEKGSTSALSIPY